MRQVSLRYDNKKVRPRVLRLLPYLQRDNEGITISESKVKLVALLQGLRALEEHYGLKGEPADDA